MHNRQYRQSVSILSIVSMLSISVYSIYSVSIYTIFMHLYTETEVELTCIASR